MLVICNGNIKSGSTWVVALVRALGKWQAVPEAWCDSRWKNASISTEHVGAFFAARPWQHDDYYCKQHWRGNEEHLRLHQHEDVKVLNSVRDIRDVLVSRYFHDIQRGKFNGESIDRYYFDGPGRAAIGRFIAYHNAWAGAPAASHHLVRYEGLVDDFDVEVTKMFDHLGVALEPSELQHLRQATTFSSVRVTHERFFRKGTVGDWTNHLGQAVVTDLLALCQELGFTYRLGAGDGR